MQHYQQQNCHIWFDEDLLQDTAKNDCFDIDYWQQQNAILGQAQGRGITWFVQTKTLAAALRHYCRGGLFGKLVKDSYFFTGFERTRAAKEFALLQFLRANDFPVPRPIAARAIKRGLIYRADILVERINQAQDLVDCLKKAPLTAKDYQQIGQLIKKLHDLQVCHSDLNIHNILRDKNQHFWLIDFDKCAKRAGDNWKQENLKRLYRSFAKEKNKVAIFWQEENWQDLLIGYKS